MSSLGSSLLTVFLKLSIVGTLWTIYAVDKYFLHYLVIPSSRKTVSVICHGQLFLPSVPKIDKEKFQLWKVYAIR